MLTQPRKLIVRQRDGGGRHSWPPWLVSTHHPDCAMSGRTSRLAAMPQSIRALVRKGRGLECAVKLGAGLAVVGAQVAGKQVFGPVVREVAPDRVDVVG